VHWEEERLLAQAAALTQTPAEPRSSFMSYDILQSGPLHRGRITELVRNLQSFGNG
jgi:hypothetical protein